MHIRSLLIILLTLIPITLKADRFSEIAEAHNVLDRMQLMWSNSPFPWIKSIWARKKWGIFDTRQNFALRSGEFLYFPCKIAGCCWAGYKWTWRFGMYAIESRVDIEAIGPDIGPMKSRALVEADFFGRTELTQIRLMSGRISWTHFRKF